MAGEQDPQGSPITWILAALGGGGGLLTLTKFVLAPLFKVWTEKAKAKRDGERKTREDAAAKAKREAESEELLRLKVIGDNDAFRAYVMRQVDELKAENRDQRRAMERMARELAQERDRTETARQAAESLREEHERCTKTIASLQDQLTAMRTELDNLKRQRGWGEMPDGIAE